MHQIFRQGWETVIWHTSVISRPLILSSRSQDCTSLGDGHTLATSPQHTQSWVSKALDTDRRPFLLTSVLLFLYFSIFHLPHQLLLSLTKVQQQYGASNLVIHFKYTRKCICYKRYICGNTRNVGVKIGSVTGEKCWWRISISNHHNLSLISLWDCHIWLSYSKLMENIKRTSYTLVTTDMPTNLWYVNEYWIFLIRHRCYYFFWLLGLVCPIWRHVATISSPNKSRTAEYGQYSDDC